MIEDDWSSISMIDIDRQDHRLIDHLAGSSFHYSKGDQFPLYPIPYHGNQMC